MEMILHVEDNKRYADTFEMIAESDFIVTRADTRETAKEKLRGGRVDIVVTDGKLETDGSTWMDIAALANQNQVKRIVILTASDPAKIDPDMMSQLGVKKAINKGKFDWDINSLVK